MFCKYDLNCFVGERVIINTPYGCYDGCLTFVADYGVIVCFFGEHEYIPYWQICNFHVIRILDLRKKVI